MAASKTTCRNTSAEMLFLTSSVWAFSNLAHATGLGMPIGIESGLVGMVII
jgi:hypothetical protein